MENIYSETIELEFVHENVDKVLSKTYEKIGSEIVAILSQEYGFDKEEATIKLGLKASKPKSSKTKITKKDGEQEGDTFAKGEVLRGKKVSKQAKLSFPIPFCGVINETYCMGIKLNHGLHTQCERNPVGAGFEYCKTCQAQADKNASGKPQLGDIRDRMNVPLLEYIDPNGRKTLPYANIVAKLGLKKEKILEDICNIGIEIPEEHWVLRETKRGRPKKEEKLTETSTLEQEKRPRGRPRKVKDIEPVVEDDLIARMANEIENAEKI